MMQRYRMRRANKAFQRGVKKQSPLDLYSFILTHPAVYSKIAHYLISYRLYHWNSTGEYRSSSEIKSRIADEREEDLKCMNFFRSGILKEIKLAIEKTPDFDKNKSSKLLEICTEAMTLLVQDQKTNDQWVINFIIDFLKRETLFDIGAVGIESRVTADKLFIKLNYYKSEKEFRRIQRELSREYRNEGRRKFEFIAQYLPISWGCIDISAPTGLFLDHLLIFLALYALCSSLKLNNSHLLLTFITIIVLELIWKAFSNIGAVNHGASLSKLGNRLKAETLKEIAGAVTKIQNPDPPFKNEFKYSTHKKTTTESSANENKNNEGSFEIKKWGTDYEPMVVKSKIKTRGIPEEPDYLNLILNEEKLPPPLEIIWRFESKTYEYNLSNPDIKKIWSNNWRRRTAVKDDFVFIAWSIFEELAQDYQLARKFHEAAQWGHAVGKKGSSGFVKTKKEIIKLKILTEISRLIFQRLENQPDHCPPGYENSRLFIPIKFIKKKAKNKDEIQSFYQK